MQFNLAISQFREWKSLNVKSQTIRGYDLNLRQFCLYMRNCNIEQVKLEDVVSWFSLMQDLEWDRNSFIPKAMALRKFFEFYKHRGFNVVDPWLVPLPRKEYKFPRVANEEQYKKILEVIPDNKDPRHIRNRAIISMLWDTGARNSEVLSLDIKDLDLVKQEAVIKTEKSQGARPIRKIMWTTETTEHLRKWIEKREYLKSFVTIKDPDALFISVCSGALKDTSGQRFTKKGVGEMLRRYANKAQIPYVNAHAFRHHMGHDLADKGANNSVIANILGHSSLQSSFVYTMMNDKELTTTYHKFKGQ